MKNIIKIDMLIGTAITTIGISAICITITLFTL